MKSKIINKDDSNLLIEWVDEQIGFGELTMKWESKLGLFLLDSEHLGVDTVIKIIKAIK